MQAHEVSLVELRLRGSPRSRAVSGNRRPLVRNLPRVCAPRTYARRPGNTSTPEALVPLDHDSVLFNVGHGSHDTREPSAPTLLDHRGFPLFARGRTSSCVRHTCDDTSSSCEPTSSRTS